MNTKNSSWRATDETAKCRKVELSVSVPCGLRGPLLQSRERAGHSGNVGMDQVPPCGGHSRGGGPSWTSWTGLVGSRKAGVRERDRGAYWPKKGCQPCAFRRFLPLAAAWRRLPPDIFRVFIFSPNGSERERMRLATGYQNHVEFASLGIASYRLVTVGATFFRCIFFPAGEQHAFRLRSRRATVGQVAPSYGGTLQEEGRAMRSAPH
jgi:hypothetical protein